MDFEQAYAPVRNELRELLDGAGSPVVDAHTHLGLDEDGRSLSLAELLAALDEVSDDARACVFPLHDPDRRPAYSVPNDRVLEWASESEGRLYPYCRLDPMDDPMPELERCLARGARGVKLHPRAQSFTFDHPSADAIFAAAGEAGVPVLVHAGRGMPTLDALIALALRHPATTLVLAHAAIGDQSQSAALLASHPAIYYDTSCLSGFDVVELYARVPAERIMFASDVPYGRPAMGLFQALRVAALAGLSPAERALHVGGTMLTLLEGGTPPAPTAPRLPLVRPQRGQLVRIANNLLFGLGAAFGGGDLDPSRATEGITLARRACRDPLAADDPVLARIDALLSAAEPYLVPGMERTLEGIGLVHAALVIAQTEPA
jgi:hypothetical protein